jgi:hypothetical protein
MMFVENCGMTQKKHALHISVAWLVLYDVVLLSNVGFLHGLGPEEQFNRIMVHYLFFSSNLKQFMLVQQQYQSSYNNLILSSCMLIEFYMLFEH